MNLPPELPDGLVVELADGVVSVVAAVLGDRIAAAGRRDRPC
jgi:hypothetical protein